MPRWKTYLSKEQQIATFGRVVDGLSVIEQAKLQRIHGLRRKLARLLKARMLAPYDELEIVKKSLLLGLAILSGAVTDAVIKTRFKDHIAAQIQFYGGPAAIMDRIEEITAPRLALAGKFAQAKTLIESLADPEQVSQVDIED